MKNTEIKYKTSTDYEKLYQLLISEISVIGFIAINIDGIPNMEYSNLVIMNYSKEHEKFDLGNIILFESDFYKDGFIKYCELQNIRFIPLELSKTKNVKLKTDLGFSDIIY